MVVVSSKNIDRADDAALDTKIKGIIPARQARSEATFGALVDAGRKFLETKTFDEMTIGEVAKSAGASVSSFYARFKDKETYFAFIQERAMTEVEEDLAGFLATLSVDPRDDRLLIAKVARFWVNIYRKNRGVYRASYKHAAATRDVWAPFKKTGHKVALMVAEKLRRHFSVTDRTFSEKDLRVALQFANGMLINAAINEPGPVSIEDTEMERYVARLILSMLDVPPPRKRAKSSTGRR